MGWWSELVQRLLRAFKKSRVDPSEVRQIPNVNQLWYAWAQDFGSENQRSLQLLRWHTTAGSVISKNINGTQIRWCSKKPSNILSKQLT